MQGVCVSGSQCNARGGIILGSCAQGYGACCAIYVTDCSSDNFQFNLTYIANPDYPHWTKTAGTCIYTLSKASSDICRIRLDFEDAILAYPSTTGLCTTDYFTASQKTGPTIPPICGRNGGHHIYLDAGAYSEDSTTFSAVLTGTSTARKWRILVSQIPCSSLTLPPQGCLQYHTGSIGSIKSFNYDTDSNFEHLSAQDYTICVRREYGHCRIGWIQSTDTDSFKLSRGSASYNGATGPSSCAADTAIILEGSNQVRSVGLVLLGVKVLCAGFRGGL